MNRPEARKPEILSPAGSWETLEAAVRAGAGAVYFGGRSFNARRNAGNFEDGDLAAAVRYCHERGVKAYITLNTLIFYDETWPALRLAEIAAAAGADALILQDVGLASLIKKAAPAMKLHASTQMSLHNIEGVRAAAELGFSRVILARELSFEEIAEIAAESPCELEVFVHGALCMSVSGQCYLSSLLLCRSGNRGLCAQPCRLPFAAPGGTGHDLSLKDLSLVRHIGELASLGIASFKIEGRMKRPEYVAAATSLCVKAVSGEESTEEELNNLQSVFSRSGFTEGYYTNRLGRDMFGIRQYEDVISAKGVLKKFQKLYEAERPSVRVDFHFVLKGNRPAELLAEDEDGFRSQAEGMVPEKAVSKEVDLPLVCEKLRKTGGTVFYAGRITADLDVGLSVPVAEINRLRRSVLQEILRQRGEPRSVTFEGSRLPEFSTGGAGKVENPPELRLRLFRYSQLTPRAAESNARYIYLPVREIERNLSEIRKYPGFEHRFGAELPRVVFGEQKELLERLGRLRRAGIGVALCGNLGTAVLARETGFSVHGDFGLNIANPYAFEKLLDSGCESCVLSFEQTLLQLGRTAAPAAQCAGILVYGRLPFMLTRNCPLKNGAGCASCGGLLTDRNGEHLPVTCGAGYSEILNPRPLWLFDRKDETRGTGTGFEQLYFTVESPEETDRVLAAHAAGEKCAGNFTRGLYYRGIK